MARQSGKIGLVKCSATVPAQVYHTTSWEIDYKGDAVDVTGMSDAGVKSFVGGLVDATIAFDCYNDSDHELNADIAPGAAILFEFYYESDDTSAWHGTAYVTDTKPTVEVTGAVKWSVTGQVSNDTTFHYDTP